MISDIDVHKRNNAFFRLLSFESNVVKQRSFEMKQTKVIRVTLVFMNIAISNCAKVKDRFDFKVVAGHVYKAVVPMVKIIISYSSINIYNLLYSHRTITIRSEMC